ncbi:hypothetical protein GALMADRAFT_146820 [Galerina marginata CBS 339.88]|uniref:Uncharacterized protein n=1 Tax=Galerina marginata (strain CBS 339.88) TaxID=685588 RepID=A0A067SCU9_GALM3|nr:hypothetical protein GALMADRAFT_146820 [Galerina marginata CBS 339.88]
MLSSRPLQLNTDGAYFPTKTPGRGLKNRAENAHAGMGATMTVQGKGKNAGMPPRTPFQPSSAQPKQLFKDQKIVLTTGRPLIDKTPLPNRVGTVLFNTPLPGNAKLSKLRNEGGHTDEEGSGTPGSAQRPSSMRKHIKHPRISGKALETPANNGNHWDVSDGDIVLPDTQPLLQETIAEDDDNSDELEYGPPNTLDLPYQPPFNFALPDYKEVGKSLFKLAHSIPYDDISPPLEPEIPYSQLEEQKWDMISLPDIESDDPFHVARIQTSSSKKLENAKPVVASQYSRLRHVNTITAANVKQRPQSSLARVGSTITSRPASRSAVSTTSVKKMASIPASTEAKATDLKSRMASGKSASRPVVTGALSTKALSNTKSKAASTSTGVRSTTAVKQKPGISTTGKPTITSGLRRPHTSMAANPTLTRTKMNTTTHRTGLNTQNPEAALDMALVKVIGNDFGDELDFKFDV